MTLFEKLALLNKQDTENGTAQVGVCNQITEVNTRGKKGFVTIGVPTEISLDLANEAFGGSDKYALLIIVDKKAINSL